MIYSTIMYISLANKKTVKIDIGGSWKCLDVFCFNNKNKTILVLYFTVLWIQEY